MFERSAVSTDFVTQAGRKPFLPAVTRLLRRSAADRPEVFALLALSALPGDLLNLIMSAQFAAEPVAGGVTG